MVVSGKVSGVASDRAPVPTNAADVLQQAEAAAWAGVEDMAVDGQSPSQLLELQAQLAVKQQGARLVSNVLKAYDGAVNALIRNLA